MLACLLLLLKRHVDASSVFGGELGAFPHPQNSVTVGFYPFEKGDGIKYFHGYTNVEVLRELYKYVPT